MLIDRKNFSRHRPWIVFVLATTALSIGWYLFSSLGSSKWPGGGSRPGIVFGVAGGLLILFEFALWGRKKVRAWRIGRAQTWMIAHIWLGLLTVPLLVLHSGFRWGGSLSTVLMILFLAVIASGVWGLLLQQILPSRILNQVPAETIHSQIGRMVHFMLEDAQRLIRSTCGPAPGEEADEDDIEDVEQGAPVSHQTIGAVQTVGSVQGKVLLTRVPQAAVPGSEPLREVFKSIIAPYIVDGKLSKSPLALSNKADAIFLELKNKLNPATYETIDILKNLCDQRRQLDRQDRLHWWLHSWLWIHLPLSIGLVVLMFFHVWVAFKYR
ncbi:hypothetical protein P12x_001652 [Tundrisphaera lichenicola]|uniref:hypothetical protein n=1 Tax=Tundrisphaera lichenicola TaxID=2029860 RepID=UPI003EC00E72